MAEARENSKLAEKIQEAVLQGGGIRRNRPIGPRKRAVTKKVTLEKRDPKLPGEVQDHVRQALLVGVATQAPCLEQSRRHHAVEVELDAPAIGIVIHPRLFAEHVPDDLT